MPLLRLIQYNASRKTSKLSTANCKRVKHKIAHTYLKEKKKKFETALEVIKMCFFFFPLLFALPLFAMCVICFWGFSFVAQRLHDVYFAHWKGDSRNIQQLNYIVVKNGRWTTQRCISIETWWNGFAKATKKQPKNLQLARASAVKLSKCDETNIDVRLDGRASKPWKQKWSAILCWLDACYWRIEYGRWFSMFIHWDISFFLCLFFILFRNNGDTFEN